ncbi:MAG TPA: chromosome segregation protein SMC [Actinomycetes bacterium]|nr:chromosome segregation protein SMC [Actinomycetes bacterium]
MHLKSLTLKGFKSFASATTLRFEPGITAVVGPNGSGKSNVVDALAWVMGEQGAKSLRGGTMEDVIFAGTPARAPLGRAEVSLTIDNTDGALPIDYAEVTLTRLMFRNGGSDYAINGTACRLLDIQELLSDSGLGREMHVIVGQGRLDAVLSATPEVRRGFIEEAAGVLKHRKRKDKALRKLDAMAANLTRLTDLTAELRRQLKPLGRQAEVARRAAVIQADARDARLRLLADELAALSATLEAEVADETALKARRAELETALAAGQAREQALETAAREAAPVLAVAQETWYRLSGLRERLQGTVTLAAERVRHGTEAPAEAPAGRDPDELDAAAAAARAEQARLAAQVAADGEALAAAVAIRKQAEAAHAEEERRMAAAARAAADRREGLARLAGKVAAAHSRVEAGEAELGRLRAAAAEAEERATRARAEFAALESQVAGLDQGEEGLDAEHESASAALDEASARADELRAAEREAERDRTAWTARREALELGLARRDGAGVLLAAGDRLSGVLGSVAALLRVQAGYSSAVAAALGAAADAVAVDSVDAAVDSLRLLKDDDAGQVRLLVGAAGNDLPMVDRPTVPAGAHAVLDLLEAPEPLRPALHHLLVDVVVVDGGLAEARALLARRPDLTVVTTDGDVLGRLRARGGSASAPSLLEVQAAVDEATTRLDEALARGQRLRFELQAASEAVQQAQRRVDAALSRLHESDARLAAVAEQLGQLGSLARAAAGEADRLTRAAAAAEAALATDRAASAELDERLAGAEAAPAPQEEPDGAERDRLAQAATEARARELEARLAVRTGEERLRATAGRAEALERSARSEREARAREAARRERMARSAATAEAVRRGALLVLDRLERSLAAAATERTDLEAARVEREATAAQVRTQVRELAEALSALVDTAHRDEVARAQQRLRIETLQARSVEEYGVDPAVLLDEYGPHQPVPPSPPAPGDPEPEVAPAPVPFVRAEQEKRLRAAERALAQLGKVNPLALEEYAALEERHAFLGEQLEDLRSTRRDLLEIVREVDERIEAAFVEAYRDTEREFRDVFARLFPGGEGRLVLTDPDDLLATGVEVEARPPGKKVKRLSLLSGGERSLTAVALLVAIFKARPSPFYVMDEVEAALDDTNLGRLLVLFEELRESSQLIVITHQKRTMEIADSLYGVSMRGDGVTTVISQRLRETEPASA